MQMHPYLSILTTLLSPSLSLFPGPVVDDISGGGRGTLSDTPSSSTPRPQTLSEKQYIMKNVQQKGNMKTSCRLCNSLSGPFIHNNV